MKWTLFKNRDIIHICILIILKITVNPSTKSKYNKDLIVSDFQGFDEFNPFIYAPVIKRSGSRYSGT